MFFTTYPGPDQELALWRLMGNISYQGIPYDVANLRDLGLPPIQAIHHSDPAGEYCGWTYYGTSDEAILILQGATPGNGTAMVASALGSSINYNSDWLLPCFRNAAQQIISTLNGIPLTWARGKITIVGHSYGGAVAIALTYYLRHYFNNDDMFTLTVGAPRPGFRALWETVETRRVRRYFAASDTVPRILPTIEESPLLHAHLSPSKQAMLNLCVQGGQGWLLGENGSATSAELPPASDTGGLLSISAWLTEQMRASSPTHSWTRYIQLFAQRQANFNNPTERARVGSAESVIETAITTPTPAQRAAVVAAREYVVNASVNQNSQVSAVGNKLLMSIRPSGGLFDVVWMGATIATFAKRGYAARCVSRGNAWIKTIQKAVDVPSAAWEDTVREFLSLAAESPGPAVPPFKISGPAA